MALGDTDNKKTPKVYPGLVIPRKVKRLSHFWKGAWMVFVILMLLLGLVFLLWVNTGCTMPSKGWFERIEIKAVEIEAHTRAQADTIKDEAIQAERTERLKAVANVPKDNNTGDWLETLIYILLGVSGFGVLGGRHALKKVIGAGEKSG